MENTKQKKKLLILAILEILRKCSDKIHALRQNDLILILEQKYGLTATRKSVGANIQELIQSGYPIVHTADGWYYVHGFDTKELDYMIKAVLRESPFPTERQVQLVRNIRGMGNRYYDCLANGEILEACRRRSFPSIKQMKEMLEEDFQGFPELPPRKKRGRPPKNQVVARVRAEAKKNLRLDDEELTAGEAAAALPSGIKK